MKFWINMAKLKISLLSFLLVMTILSAILGMYLSRWKFNQAWENGYELDHQVSFLNGTCHVVIYAEEGASGPSWRQRRWLSKILRDTDPDLLDDAAEIHRADIDASVGLAEYGLGHINRQNIAEYYGVGMIVIPRLNSSDDNYVIYCASCQWEEEHGMRMMLKNNTKCIYTGPDEPWNGKKDPSEFEKSLK